MTVFKPSQEMVYLSKLNDTNTLLSNISPHCFGDIRFRGKSTNHAIYLSFLLMKL